MNIQKMKRWSIVGVKRFILSSVVDIFQNILLKKFLLFFFRTFCLYLVRILNFQRSTDYRLSHPLFLIAQGVFG